MRGSDEMARAISVTPINTIRAALVVEILIQLVG